MRSGWWIVALAGCGRIAFGESDDAGNEAARDSAHDTGPMGPLLVSGQAAEIALGQPDLTTNTVGTVSASSLQGPESVVTDGTRLWVCGTRFRPRSTNQQTSRSVNRI